MKPIRLSQHAKEQCEERGAQEAEVMHAVRHGSRESVRAGRLLCRASFQYDDLWRGRRYHIKQVAAVIAEEPEEIVVVTVFTFYYSQPEE